MVATDQEPIGPNTRGYVYDFDAPPAAASEQELIALLGGKGGNLAVMANQLGLPVPPGFTITTEACRRYLAGEWPAGLDDELREHVARLGARLGREFGAPEDPLLVSVRSGAPVSMPGMMDTILDLGLCSSTIRGLSRVSGEQFAADCQRRLREGWQAVIGADQLPDDPWAQLRTAIEAVFRSWNSARAQAFRQHEGIPDDLGTAVTVQAMVFGNRGPDSGTGVLFTRNPSTGEPVLFGDIMFDAQGEDVVAGTHATQSIAVLDTRLPAVAEELRRYSALLERHYADLCDIEFTIEDGRLWMLQVRVGKRSPRAALRMAIDMADDPDFPLSREQAVRRVAALLAKPPRTFVPNGVMPEPIAHGLPASPGIASGGVVTAAADAQAAAAAGGSVILVRSETSPEDVAGMAASAGVLTARGGLASHAAVVARGWGIPAVVGAPEVALSDESVTVGSHTIRLGEELTIDGSTGAVYLGRVDGSHEIVPEAATLLGWAQELGIALGSAGEDGEKAGGGVDAAAESIRQLTADDVLRTVSIKGSALPDQLPEALLAAPELVESQVEQLQADGLVESSQGSLRPTVRGKLKSGELFDADRARLGVETANARLTEFHAFDGRMKEIVTAWQVREVAGEQTFNDHSDAAYDAAVLGRLADLHYETAAWLGPLGESIARFDVYRTRLGRAIDAARNGDQRFVASPRVDSYHGVWFELHEDLIRLSGQKRADVA